MVTISRVQDHRNLLAINLRIILVHFQGTIAYQTERYIPLNKILTKQHTKNRCIMQVTLSLAANQLNYSG